MHLEWSYQQSVKFSADKDLTPTKWKNISKAVKLYHATHMAFLGLNVLNHDSPVTPPSIDSKGHWW